MDSYRTTYSVGFDPSTGFLHIITRICLIGINEREVLLEAYQTLIIDSIHQ